MGTKIPYTTFERILIAALFLVALFHILTIMRFPPPFVDEVWQLSRSIGFTETYRPFGELDRGVFDKFNNPWMAFQILPSALYAIPLFFLEEPSLLPLRMIVLLFDSILLFALYFIGRTFGGRETGLLSALIAALSPQMLHVGHQVRPDIMASAVGHAALALFLLSTKPSFQKSIAIGSLAALATWLHPNSGVFGTSIAALYVFHYKWQVIRQKSFWGYVFGASIFFGFYYCLHVLPDKDSYTSLFELAFAATHIPPLLTFDLRIILSALGNLPDILETLPYTLLPAIFVGITTLRKKNPEQGKLLLFLLVTHLLTYALLIRNLTFYYQIHLAPLFAIPIAFAFLELRHLKVRKTFLQRFSWAFLLALSIAPSIERIRHYKYNWGTSAENTIQEVSRLIGANDIVLGPQTYWLGLRNNNYLSWENLIYYQRYAPGSSLKDAFEKFRPDIFIIDRHVRFFIHEEQDSELYSGLLWLKKDILNAILSEHATLEKTLFSPAYEAIQIYRFHWPEKETP